MKLLQRCTLLFFFPGFEDCNSSVVPLSEARSVQEEELLTPSLGMEDVLSMDARVKQQPQPLAHELGWTTM